MSKFRFLLLLIFPLTLLGNNIQVANIALMNQTIGSHTEVEFDLSWENSWRISSGPANWDAAWVFVKYQKNGEYHFRHATLSTNAAHHTVNNTNGVASTIQPSTDGKGVFIHRSANGAGNINWQDIRLRWNYNADGVTDNEDVIVKVFAIEMVYIPQGSFYLGDGNINASPSVNAFRINNTPATNPKGNEAYLVTSEAAITFVASSSTSLVNAYDPLNSNGYTLPASYPKGFNAFYTMKYELSQKAYVDFFNTLPTSPVGDPSKGARHLRQGIYGSTAADANARNNFNWSGNNIDNADLSRLSGSASGDRAQNWMNWYDAVAYADWSALRPMSEFEWEKAARGHDVNLGPIYPINGEYAWGNTNISRITATSSIVNNNTNSETVGSATTYNVNSQSSSATYQIGPNTTGDKYGPVRNGAFAARGAAINSRELTGASYYGLMEMSGNLQEFVVATAWYQTNTYRAISLFNGSHGDGEVNNGSSDVSNWNLVGGYAIYSDIAPALKGGSYAQVNSTPAISDRSGRGTYLGIPGSGSYIPNSQTSHRGATYGFRACRTAP